MAAWPQIDFVDDREGCLFTATVHRKPSEKIELVNISSESLPKTDMASVKLRERVGYDSGYLQGKALCYHPGVGFTDWHYRAIGAAKYSETAARRIAAQNWRENGRPLGSFIMTKFGGHGGAAGDHRLPAKPYFYI